MMQRIFLVAGGLAGAVAVATGAWSAHGGAAVLSAETAVTFEKAVRYTMHHGLALLLVAALLDRPAAWRAPLVAAGWLFLAGLALFSGTVYILALTGFSFGYLTPLGGTSFILGWLALALAGVRAGCYASEK